MFLQNGSCSWPASCACRIVFGLQGSGWELHPEPGAARGHGAVTPSQSRALSPPQHIPGARCAWHCHGNQHHTGTKNKPQLCRAQRSSPTPALSQPPPSLGVCAAGSPLLPSTSQGRAELPWHSFSCSPDPLRVPRSRWASPSVHPENLLFSSGNPQTQFPLHSQFPEQHHPPSTPQKPHSWASSSPGKRSWALVSDLSQGHLAQTVTKTCRSSAGSISQGIKAAQEHHSWYKPHRSQDHTL